MYLTALQVSAYIYTCRWTAGRIRSRIRSRILYDWEAAARPSHSLAGQTKTSARWKGFRDEASLANHAVRPAGMEALGWTNQPDSARLTQPIRRPKKGLQGWPAVTHNDKHSVDVVLPFQQAAELLSYFKNPCFTTGRGLRRYDLTSCHREVSTIRQCVISSLYPSTLYSSACRSLGNKPVIPAQQDWVLA